MKSAEHCKEGFPLSCRRKSEAGRQTAIKVHKVTYRNTISLRATAQNKTDWFKCAEGKRASEFFTRKAPGWNLRLDLWGIGCIKILENMIN
jgi:hypothetical protein